MALGTRIFNAIARFNHGILIPTSAGVGKVLTSDASGNGMWEGAPTENSTAIAYRKVTQKIKSGSFTKIELDTVIKDPGGNMPGPLTLHGYVVPADGYYHCDGQVSPRELTANFAVLIFTNKLIKLEGPTIKGFSSVANGIIFCKKGDLIELYCYQESGAEAKTAEAAEEYSNYLCVQRVGAGPAGPTGLGGPDEHGRSSEMIAGKITIAAPAVTATGTILVSVEGTVALAGILAITKRNAGESFVVESSLVTSTDRVNWSVWK
jgi:hypothetical protein